MFSNLHGLTAHTKAVMFGPSDEFTHKNTPGSAYFATSLVMSETKSASTLYHAAS
jgi:hypothetical protein